MGRSEIDLVLAPDDQYTANMKDEEKARVDRIRVARIKKPDIGAMFMVAMEDVHNTTYYTTDPERYKVLLERKAKLQGEARV